MVKWFGVSNKGYGFMTAVMALLVTMAPLAAYERSNGTRIQELVDTAMHYYRTDREATKAEAEKFKTITPHERNRVIQQSFADAAVLAPERLDFKYGVLGSQIFDKNFDGAHATLTTILAKAPAAFEAQAWSEALARVAKDETAAQLAHQAMNAIDRGRADAYRQRFARVEQIMADTLVYEVPQVPEPAMIVTLGYALAMDGTAQKPLLDRLGLTLKIAEANPRAGIMLSGGVARNGVTEGDIMARWLVDKDIERNRLSIEDKSRDTVGNGLNVANLLRRHTVDTVILVTSASHMRRARVLMEEALKFYGLPVTVIPIAVLDAETPQAAAVVSPDERLSIYRDLIRISGIWIYPGFDQ